MSKIEGLLWMIKTVRESPTDFVTNLEREAAKAEPELRALLAEQKAWLEKERKLNSRVSRWISKSIEAHQLEFFDVAQTIEDCAKELQSILKGERDD